METIFRNKKIQEWKKNLRTAATKMLQEKFGRQKKEEYFFQGKAKDGSGPDQSCRKKICE